MGGCKRPNLELKYIGVLLYCLMQSDTKQKRDEALPLGESVPPEAQPIASGVWVGSSP